MVRSFPGLRLHGLKFGRNLADPLGSALLQKSFGPGDSALEFRVLFYAQKGTDAVVLAAVPGQTQGMDVLHSGVFKVQGAFRQGHSEELLRVPEDIGAVDVAAVDDDRLAGRVPPDPADALIKTRRGIGDATIET